MNVDPTRLETAIRDQLAPILREEGFAGSGRTFRRTIAGVIQLVNVQAFWFGGRFAVNLSAHPLGLPSVGGKPVDPKKITEEKCEFRHRLTEGTANQAWDHDASAEGMAVAMADATAVFKQHSQRFFGLFSGAQSILFTLTPDEFAKEAETLRLFCMGSSIRLAFTFARFRALQGKNAEAAMFARLALSQTQPTFQGYEELLKLAKDA
jgi:hypothetical protein